MKEDYHIDLSIRLFDKGTTGIACVGSISRKHNGCALGRRLKKYVNKKLIQNNPKIRAKIYAICIYYLIENKLEDIKTLVICNDEDFDVVKTKLEKMLKEEKLQTPSIINITEYQTILGRRVKSVADNYARAYRKRGMRKNKWNKGKKLNMVEITFRMIKKKL